MASQDGEVTMTIPGIRKAQPRDLETIRALLRASDLTESGVAEHLDDFVVADPGNSLEAVAGLEVYGDCALLRSVAVRGDRRGHGHGRTIVDAIVRQASRRGVRELYLLTTTAEPFFSRLGFETVDRALAPEAIANTSEFSELCPQSAAFMRRRLA